MIEKQAKPERTNSIRQFLLGSAVRSLAGALLLASILLKTSGEVEDFCKGILVGFIIGSFIYEIAANKMSPQDPG